MQKGGVGHKVNLFLYDAYSKYIFPLIGKFTRNPSHRLIFFCLVVTAGGNICTCSYPHHCHFKIDFNFSWHV